MNYPKILGGVFTITLALAIVFYKSVAGIVWYWLLSMGFVTSSAGAAFVVFWFLNGVEKYKVNRANRKKIEADSSYSIEKVGSQLFIKESNKNAVWQNRTQNPVIYANGRQQNPSQNEMDSWEQLNLKKVPRKERIALRESIAPLNLLTSFMEPERTYGFIAGAQTGKTFQARFIAEAWRQRNIIPWIIGPKIDIENGEWGGCKFWGKGQDYEAIESGLALVRQEAKRRHESDKGHKSHKILPVFLDDWTTTIEEVESARKFVIEGNTLYASVNIILYFILHSDTADAWGVATKGASLKNDAIKLKLVSTIDQDGKVIRSETKGIVFFPDKAGRPVDLMTGQLPVLPVEIMEADTRIIENETWEHKVKDLVDGGMSKNKACYIVTGRGYGGNNVMPIKSVLGEV